MPRRAPLIGLTPEQIAHLKNGGEPTLAVLRAARASLATIMKTHPLAADMLPLFRALQAEIKRQELNEASDIEKQLQDALKFAA